MKAVKRLKVESYEGKTPALGDGQVRVLPDVLGIETLKGRSPAYPTLNPVFFFFGSLGGVRQLMKHFESFAL
jgi:hypothetical protein